MKKDMNKQNEIFEKFVDILQTLNISYDKNEIFFEDREYYYLIGIPLKLISLGWDVFNEFEKQGFEFVLLSTEYKVKQMELYFIKKKDNE